MANVRLTPEQCQGDDLPPLCARCGRPAVDRVERAFAWHPPWLGVFILLGVLPGVVLMIYHTRRRTVRLPMCDRHRRHWKNPALATLIGLPVCVALMPLGAVVFRTPGVTVAGVYLFLAGVVGIAVWNGRLIRPDRIDADGIVLAGVHQEFADAVKESRDERPARGYDEYDDEEPTRRRPNRYDIDVDE